MLLLLTACSDIPSNPAPLEGPIAAELRFDRDSYGAIGANLVVTAPREAVAVTGCGADADAALASDGTSDRLAYRCRPDAEWITAYLGPKQLHNQCTPTLGTGAEPDWSRAPATLALGAAAMVACRSTTPQDQAAFGYVLDDVERMGPDALGAVLVQTVGAAGAGGWDEHAGRMPADHAWRDALRAWLRGSPIAEPGTCRAIRALGTDDEVVLARAPELLADYPHAPCVGEREALLANLIRRSPEVGLPLACAPLAAVDTYAHPGGWSLAPLYALVRSDASCDLRPWVTQLRCEPALRCADHLCRAAELEPVTAEQTPVTMNGYHALLAVAYRAGPVPGGWGEGCPRE